MTFFLCFQTADIWCILSCHKRIRTQPQSSLSVVAAGAAAAAAEFPDTVPPREVTSPASSPTASRGQSRLQSRGASRGAGSRPATVPLPEPLPDTTFADAFALPTRFSEATVISPGMTVGTMSRQLKWPPELTVFVATPDGQYIIAVDTSRKGLQLLRAESLQLVRFIGIGTLKNPSRVALNEHGEIVVSDFEGGKVNVYKLNGVKLAVLSCVLPNAYI